MYPYSRVKELGYGTHLIRDWSGWNLSKSRDVLTNHSDLLLEGWPIAMLDNLTYVILRRKGKEAILFESTYILCVVCSLSYRN
jgi:hypothetical protein